MRRRLLTGMAMAVGLTVAMATPALACGGLVAPNGTVRLLRTTTLAAYTDGVEHYITSFSFLGGGAELGSIVPLPAVPTSVVRGGDWTLQRLDRETRPQLRAAAGGDGVADAAFVGKAEVLLETTIDALDITVLKGGGTAVGDWAREHGFQLSPDAPEVLDFYANRSPIFLAARFNATAARERGQQVGDGTPIHVTMPTDNPWVPLRILGLGRAPAERIEADVYLLTDERPSLLYGERGVTVTHDAAATPTLLDDLRSDKGMEWVPESMWLSKLAVDAEAGDLYYDLAIDAGGTGRPSLVDAGLAATDRVIERAGDAGRSALPLAAVAALAGALLVLAFVLARSTAGTASAGGTGGTPA